MSNEPSTAQIRNFTVSTEIFYKPELDIYSQMIYIVLSSSSGESITLSVEDIAAKGRMTTRQAVKAMQDLVAAHLIPHKLFRRLIGEFQDDRLSWAAKGLLTYCKEHRDITLGELLQLSDQSGESEHNIRQALTELESNGYLEDYPELGRLAR